MVPLSGRVFVSEQAGLISCDCIPGKEYAGKALAW
jgi:hypothetical protein